MGTPLTIIGVEMFFSHAISGVPVSMISELLNKKALPSLVIVISFSPSGVICVLYQIAE